MMLMPHAVVNEVQGIETLAHIVHQAHTVCTQLIHISMCLAGAFGVLTTTHAVCKQVSEVQTCKTARCERCQLNLPTNTVHNKL